MAIQKNITRTKTNTRRMVFHLTSKSFPNGVDLTSWSLPKFFIDDREFPEDVATLRQTITGAFLTPTTEGRISFVPDGTLPTGKYFYQAIATDDNDETFTFKKGSYTVEESMG